MPAAAGSYDWNTAMGNLGIQGGNWFNPQQMNAAAMPSPAGFSMPTSTDLGWSMPNSATGGGSPFAPAGVNTQYAPGFDGGAAAAPQGFMAKAGNWLGNGQNLSAVMQGIGALTSAWLGYQNLRVAKDQLSFQKDAFSKNYKNQTQSYNTSLEDRIRGRTADYAGKEADVQAYLDKHKLGG
jgi:hypothetical protein